MGKIKNIIKVSDEIILNKIIVLRKKRVMIDKDLAELYGVTTKRLNETNAIRQYRIAFGNRENKKEGR